MDSKMEALVKGFERAGLLLRPAKEAFARGDNAEDVFGMGIQREVRGTTRKEWFRIWWGSDNNRVEILNIDKDLKQLVLLVHEPEREFEMPVPWHRPRWD